MACVEGTPHLFFVDLQEDTVIGAFAVDEVGPPAGRGEGAM